MRRALTRGLWAVSIVVTLLAATSEAAVRPQANALLEKSFRQPELNVGEIHRPVDELPGLASGLLEELSLLNLQADSGFFDPRSGRSSSLILSRPLVPGTGVDNALGWEALGGAPADEAALRAAVWQALRSYLTLHRSELRVDLAELGDPRIGVFEDGNLIQVQVPRVVAGIPVRDGSLTAVVNHGNLVLLGLQNSADVEVPASLAGEEAAREVVAAHVQPYAVAATGRVRQELVPTMRDGEWTPSCPGSPAHSRRGPFRPRNSLTGRRFSRTIRRLRHPFPPGVPCHAASSSALCPRPASPPAAPPFPRPPRGTAARRRPTPRPRWPAMTARPSPRASSTPR